MASLVNVSRIDEVLRDGAAGDKASLISVDKVRNEAPKANG
jgi:hypothetical protein